MDAWNKVPEFVSEMERFRNAGVPVDSRMMLKVMRVIYDRAENDPGLYPDFDRQLCGLAIEQLERMIGEGV